MQHIKHIYQWFFCLLLLAGSSPCLAQATKTGNTPAADSTKSTAGKDTASKKGFLQLQPNRQLRVSIDLAAPAMSFLYNNRKGFEIAVDYTYKNETYLVAEAGFGTGKYDYPDLSYHNANPFLKLGFDKNLLYRAGKTDWDMGFFGLRAGMAEIYRGTGNYVITDSLWGNSSGTVPAKNSFVFWLELTAGVKVELMKNFFVGWTARGKIMISQGIFKELPPAYITGYGKGDKSGAATFNVYIAYALRWEK